MRSFDAERFAELVLYISKKTEGDPDFGRTKLAKVLFYSDFTAYGEDGDSLTGATYEKWPHGPFPRELPATEQRLAGAMRARVERLERLEPRGEFDPNRLFALAEPDKALFEGWELYLVDTWISRIAKATAQRISDLSHDHPGWILVGEKEAIPYHSHFTSRRTPSRRDLARGEELALEHGWP